MEKQSDFWRMWVHSYTNYN